MGQLEAIALAASTAAFVPSASPLTAVVLSPDTSLCERLRDFVSHCDNATMVADAISTVEAIGVIERHQPGLIFLDGRLAAASGWARFRRYKPPPYVVFLSDREHHLRQVSRISSTPCLSLGCTREECVHVVSNLGEEEDAAGASADFRPILSLLTGRRAACAERVAFRCGLDHVLFEPSEIDWVAHDEHSGTTIQAGCKRYQTSSAFDLVWSRLRNQGSFVLLAKNTLVNVEQIRELRVRPGYASAVALYDGTELPVARRFVGSLCAKLGISRY